VGKVRGTPCARVYMGVWCTWVKLLTDLQILGCTQKCVWRPGSVRTRWGAIALPGPPNRYKGRGGREREEKGRKYEGRKGSEGKDVKG